MFETMDAGNITAVVLLDMSAAFDTVDHSILTQTLRSVGVTGLALEWFQSYLASRSQYVKINDSNSDPAALTCGVPQGSVGGPLLFSLYLSRIRHIFERHDIQYHCYADDIQIFVSFSPTRTELTEAVKRLELCIDDVKAWMERNGLKFNDSKSEFILIGSKQMLSKVNSDTCYVRIGNSNIKPSNKVRNLGVVYDANLTFKDHISYVSHSVRFHLRNLGSIRRYLTRSAAEKLMHALISSRLDFCNSLFCSLPQKELSKLQRLQNCGARLLTVHTTPILRSLHWLPVEKRINFKILLLVYRTLRKFAPVYLQNTLHLHQPPRNLRSSNSLKLQVPRIKHNWGDRAFSYMGPKLWNGLPKSLREASSIDGFKKNLMTYIFNFN